MLATSRREGRTLIIATVVLLFLLLAVVLWFRVPRREVVPTMPPARVQTNVRERVVAHASATVAPAQRTALAAGLSA